MNHTNHIKYDCVVTLRIDCVFQNNFVFNILEDNTIYIPFGNDWTGINDQIAYGKVDVMKKYNSICPVYLLENSHSIPHPESLTLANILFYKLKIERPHIQWYIEK